jgi:TRAP-type C4-dicarboxylate transport system permease small subunit
MAKKRKPTGEAGRKPGAAKGDEEPKKATGESAPPPSKDEDKAERAAVKAAPVTAEDAEVTNAPKPPTASKKPVGAAWAEPFVRFEAAWTRLETRLVTFVLLWLLSALVAWVAFGGLAAPLNASNAAGSVFRGGMAALALGLLGWRLTKDKPLNTRRAATIGGIVFGILTTPFWRSFGIEYFDNLRGWLQEGSFLTLMGGLRGLGTRLTLWLALLGASLATASGKHIHIDVIFRFLPVKARKPVVFMNYTAAMLVCFSAVWGFFDHIAIENFGADQDQTATEKIQTVIHHGGNHLFLATRQVGLDLTTLPHVISGDRYDKWMGPTEWNAWVADAGFEGRYTAEQIASLNVPLDGPPHTPVVVAPDGENARGILVHLLNLVFPFGMFVIGLRFLLRLLMTLSGSHRHRPQRAARHR